MNFTKLNKLKAGDKVAILSPSFAAPGQWPHMYELGLMRLRDIFGLEPVEFPTTKKLGASKEERSADLIRAFEDASIKAVITSIGGDDQVTYVKDLPVALFKTHPKPFFGYSDNTHLANFLWLAGIPSYYGASLHTQFALNGCMNPFTVGYIKKALFESGEFELTSSEMFNDIGLDWNDSSNMAKELAYEKNDGWFWDGEGRVAGRTWGGCLESIDEMLRHGSRIPELSEFEDIVLFTETCEEISPASYVFRVYRALGERGILERVKAVLVGRPKSWEFDKQKNPDERKEYRKEQRETITQVVRMYNKTAPIVQNMDFGHTEPQIPLPYGGMVRIDSLSKKVFAEF